VRVLLVSHRYPPDALGGLERVTQSLAGELAAAGDEVSIVARRWSDEPPTPELRREQLPGGVNLYRLTGGGEVVHRRFLVHAERLEKLFGDVMGETQPEVVHVIHLLGHSPAVIQMARHAGAAVVLSLDDFYFACQLQHLQKFDGRLCAGPRGGMECAQTCFSGNGAAAEMRWGIRTMYFRRQLEQVERLVCASECIRAFHESYGVDPGRLLLVPHGVSFGVPAGALRVPGEREQGGPLRLAVLGTLVPHKGAHFLLEAFDLADLGEVELVLFGQTPNPRYASDLRLRAERISGLTLRLWGAYEPSELARLLSGIDCVVVPSQVPESFSIATREALTLGIPVLASRLGAPAEAVTDGENGFTFDPHEPTELAAILRRLVDQPALLDTLSAGARRTPVVTIAEHAAAMRSIYQEAIDARRQAGPAEAVQLDELAFLRQALLNLGLADVGSNRASAWRQ
jgi:glycosyltransferase involved in cell wall biosynthesis